MTEQWRTVPGQDPRYEVSDYGRVRSWAGTRGSWRTAPRLLHLRVNRYGYPTVGFFGLDKIPKRFTVHSLVAAAFVGPRPRGADVRHINGDRLDARAVNLTYGSRSDNITDQVVHGTHANAAKTECANGHPFSPDNTSLSRDGKTRTCITCRRAAKVRWYARHHLEKESTT